MATPTTPNSPNDLTRQQLDELDTLLQRMLSLPLNKPDATTPTGQTRAELPLPEPPAPPRPPLPPVPRPEPVNWLPAPPEPMPAPQPKSAHPFLGLTGGPDPEPATEYTPRSSESRTLADLLPFPIPDGPPPDEYEELLPETPLPGGPGRMTGTLRGVDAPATPAGFRSAMPPAAPQPTGQSMAFLAPPPPDAPPSPGPGMTAGTPGRPAPVMTPPPPASNVGLLAPVSLATRLIEGILDWCGPLGTWLTRPAVKQLLGVVGLGLLAGSAWWVARGMGWVG